MLNVTSGVNTVVSAYNCPPSHVWRSGYRPTVAAMVCTPDQELVMVLPQKANPHGWIFPQGGIHRNETIMEAAVREVHEELGWQPDWCKPRTESLICEGRTDSVHGRTPLMSAGKHFYGVFLELTRWQPPQLNGENSRYCLVGGPNQLWPLLEQCSQQKKQLLLTALQTALVRGLLCSKRWTVARSAPLVNFA